MSTKPRRPTLQDVADRVGITKMTVSRYLRDPGLVSAAVQEKIALALDELGYIPNRAPDLLSNAKSKAIGVLLPSLTNQVFSEVIRGVESITEAAGYQTMLAHYGYSSEVEQERIASLLSYHVDGLILSESYHTERTLRMIDGLREVYNELGIGPASSLGSRSTDSFITSKVKARLVDTNQVSANHIKVVTERGIVYLMGIVSEREAKVAVAVARTTDGVRKVVNVMEVVSEDETRRIDNLTLGARNPPPQSAPVEKR